MASPPASRARPSAPSTLRPPSSPTSAITVAMIRPYGNCDATTATPTRMSATSATTIPMSAGSAGSSISVTGEVVGKAASFDFDFGSSSAGRSGDGSVTSARPIAAAGRVSSAATDRAGGGGAACGSFAQPGSPSDGMTVKLLLQLGHVALAPMFDCGARTPPARQ